MSTGEIATPWRRSCVCSLRRRRKGGYIAQGLEIDSVSTSCTVEQVQETFADGLLRSSQTMIARNRPLTGRFESHAPKDA